jgi:spermidine synthase
MNTPSSGRILKIAIFATGCAGIVAEFVLSTLATYVVGNAVFQWTIIMSLMLFSMGVGSRVSKHIRRNLLEAFILTEFALSILCAGAVTVTYGLMPHVAGQINIIIYLLAMAIGGLIGCEIPLVTRINQAYEELRGNIASVMEKDYYGSLLGGLFFAFFALPYLGLTYTPVILGTINFSVAGLLLFYHAKMLRHKRIILPAFVCCLALLITTAVTARSVIVYGEQRQYLDRVVFSHQTAYQKIVITQWKEHHWLYINGQEQFSTYDEERYHEPLVHPAMARAASRRRVLILGGGDGLALREVLTYEDVESVTLVDIDPFMTRLAAENPILTAVNKGALKHSKTKVVNQDAKAFLRETPDRYDVIIIDLPDPDSIDLMHLYSADFYTLVKQRLTRGGIVVTQAASPDFARKAFLCIFKTMASTGLAVLPYHNHIPTMGEWGWVLGVNSDQADTEKIKKRLLACDFDSRATRYLNNDAVIAMLHFGKGIFDAHPPEAVKINTESDPVLYDYYRKGPWALY